MSRPEIVDVWGVGAAPAVPIKLSKGGRAKPPPSRMIVGAAGAAQISKIGNSRPAQKHDLNAQVYAHCAPEAFDKSTAFDQPWGVGGPLWARPASPQNHRGWSGC